MKLLKEGKINLYLYNDKEVVSVREIYNNLTVGRDFSTWVSARFHILGLEEDIDYISVKEARTTKGRAAINYYVSVETAIKMVKSMRTNKENLEVLNCLVSLADKEFDIVETKPKKKAKKKNKAKSKKNVSSAINEVACSAVGSPHPISVISTTLFKDEMFGEIRMVMVNNNPHAIATDVAKALGYKNPSKGVYDHCRSITKCYIPHPQNVEKQILVNAIPQGDIIRLIMGSKLPSAERFENWIINEVIPSVMKHGFYATTDTVENFLSNPDAAIKLFENYKKEREEKLALLKEKSENQYKVVAYEDFINSNDTYSFSATAKMLRIPRTAESKNLVGKNTLLAWMRRDGILMTSGEERNMPYQSYVNRGWFEINAIDNEDTSRRIAVRVTPKGVEGIYKKYRYDNMPKKIIIENCEDDLMSEAI